MENLFDKWKTKVPKFNEIYKATLFDSLSATGGGSEKKTYNLGKHFSNNYEFYMYAFFLGLYKDQFKPMDKDIKRADFGHPIQFWGNKAGRIGREDFAYLQEYLFSAVIAKTDIALIDLDKGTLSEEDAVKSLINTMEAYTNGGLMLISEKLEDNPNHFLQSPSFLNMIVEKI